MKNDEVEAVVSPQTGRIVGLKKTGGENLLWLNDIPSEKNIANCERKWANYGGSRVWVSPEGRMQFLMLGRAWPADTASDGLPWQVLKKNDKSLLMQSTISEANGLRVLWEIQIPEKGATIINKYKFEKFSDKQWLSHIWPVTMLNLPEYVLTDVFNGHENKVNTFGTNYANDKHLILDKELSCFRFNWPKYQKAKVGVMGNWMAAVYKDTVLTQYVRSCKNGFYIDNANCEIFLPPENNFLEMEALSPVKLLKKGETQELTVVWKLFNKNSNDNLKDIVKEIEERSPKL